MSELKSDISRGHFTTMFINVGENTLIRILLVQFKSHRSGKKPQKQIVFLFFSSSNIIRQTLE